MKGYLQIEQKLQQFSKKYYTNKLIKGSIFFLSFGLLYLLFILFVEYFLWLQPLARTVLFWVFVLVEIFLFIRFIFFPIFKLIGLQKGISFEQASIIIGNHFPEVQDKLLNVLQLKQTSNPSDLLIASIEQKSTELKTISFTKAISFKSNTKYLKYLTIPLVIWVFTLFLGVNIDLSKSFTRVVNHSVAYNPPAPFYFSFFTKKFEAIERKPFTIHLKTIGSVVPNEVKIVMNNQQFFLQNNNDGTFSYTFSELIKPIDFYVTANGVQSQKHTINVIKVPAIQQIKMEVFYPKYTHIKNKSLSNITTISVPEGTKIIWKAFTKNTDTVVFSHHKKRTMFTLKQIGRFELYKQILEPLQYQITSSNKQLKDYESLQFSVDVVKDEYPKIVLQTNIDSVYSGNAQFIGQISDDYGFSKLQLVYFDKRYPQKKQYIPIPISSKNLQSFYYQFPDTLTLQENTSYQLFFEVFDNDGINGRKKNLSKIFTYQQKSKEEITQELLLEQKNNIRNLENTLQQQKHQQKALKKIQQDFQSKKTLRWNDQKQLQNFIKRQQEYKQMMQRNTDKIQQNLHKKTTPSKSLQEKKEAIQKRITELKKMKRQQELLKEIEKMAQKLNKEELLQKTKELAQQNKQYERSLERILELTKRFYIEQKTVQIANKLKKLAKEQEKLAKKKETNLTAQEAIQKKFKEIQKELKELEKENEKLKKPMEFPETDDEQEEIEQELKKASQKISEKQSLKAKKSQKKAANQMQKMHQKIQQSMMDMQGDSVEENIEDLRKILENLIIFSYKQEDLMQQFSSISTHHPDFGKSIKEQQVLKSYFNHIDDSLYVLSMRLPKLSTKIQDHLASAHYNLDQSLENFTENRFSTGILNQRYVMTAANTLADYLSSILTNMKNSMSKSGKGKKGGKSFSLPDLIEKQKGLSDKMKKGLQKNNKGNDGKNGSDGKKDNQGKGNNKEQKNGELFKIYQEQTQLRQQLQDAIQQGKDKNGAARRTLKTMEELENEILEKGFNMQTLQKMQQLHYQLLKLDKATFEQGEDNKRKSHTNFKDFSPQKIKEIQFKKRFYQQTEILNRQSLPLRQNFKKKVKEYFTPTKSN